MTDLILRPSDRYPDRPYALQLRHHGPVETDYATLCHITYERACEIVAAGAPRWLYGPPDADDVHLADLRRRAAAMRAQADQLDAQAKRLRADQSSRIA